MVKKRIKRFGVIQTAKVAAVIYFFIGAIIIFPFWLFSSIVQSEFGFEIPFFGGMFFILIPVIYALASFIMVAIACLFYNLIAKFIGGIEVEVENMDLGQQPVENRIIT